MGVSATIDRMNERNKRAGRYAYLVPDTAHNCPVLRTGMGCQKDVPENRNSLKREVFLFPSLFLHPTKPLPSSAFLLYVYGKAKVTGIYGNAEDDRQVSQSGKPLCTGASLWAVPKLARGLCPLEPWHANGGNSVLEISTGYFFSDCHGLAKTLSCIYQRGTLHIPLWNPLLI